MPAARVETLAGKFDGNDKWLGGVASPCGTYIYGVPGHAKRVLRITVATGACDLIGPEFKGKFKWLRGVAVAPELCSAAHPAGLVFALPCCAGSVLRIDPATQTVATLPCATGSFAWHGGDVGRDGRIYAVPANADRVLVVDPRTSEISYVGEAMPGKQKWYGGVMGANGCIYCIPHMASSVLKIDTRRGATTLLETRLPEGLWKWHGGAANRAGTTVYGFPNNADAVLKIDVATDAVALLPGPLASGRHRAPQDGKYKYLGGALSSVDDALYCFPCDAERVLRVTGDDVSLVGPSFVFPLAEFPLPHGAPKAASNGSGCNVSMSVNKWQNGFALEDGAVYAIPQRSTGVLRVLPKADGSAPDVSLLDCGQAAQPIDLFEGGVLGGDGCMYCIPLRGRSVLKVVPARPEAPWFPETRRLFDALFGSSEARAQPSCRAPWPASPPSVG